MHLYIQYIRKIDNLIILYYKYAHIRFLVLKRIVVVHTPFDKFLTRLLQSRVLLYVNFTR